MKRILPLMVLSAASLAATIPAHAQVFIKPIGWKAIPVRVQNLTTDTEIIGSLAVTNWTMEIHMQNAGFGGWNNEAAVCDFICVRPYDAKVTAFNASNLEGHVVEKAIATPRVAFRAAPNDPLRRSGLGASNSFRATVYPINRWNRVTVKGTWVQPLRTSRAGTTTFQLPLLGLRGVTTRLESLTSKITIRNSGATSLSNSYHLPLKTEAGARVLSLSQKNYRVLNDLTVTLSTPKPPSTVEMLVESKVATGGTHFALAFVANRPLSQFALSGSGIDSGTQFSAKSAKAGDVVIATGTYSGDPTAIRAELSANGLPTTSLIPIENSAARALWATQKINALSAGTGAKTNRAQIISLSKSYSVVSPFTTWLTVGQDDLKFYRRALVSSQLDPLVREYWKRVGDGEAKTARVTRLKKSIAQISTANGLIAKDELYVRLGSALRNAAAEGYVYGNPPKTKTEKNYVNLQKAYNSYIKTLIPTITTKNPYDYYQPGGDAVSKELGILSTKTSEEYSKPHPDYTKIAQWERRFALLYGSGNSDPSLGQWQARATAMVIEAQTTAAEKAGDQTRLAQIEKERLAFAKPAYSTNNVGDPPIYVDAPADARQVVAVMPDGQVKTLDYNPREKRWEGNYDVPVGTKDGDYAIQILIVLSNGTRHRQSQPFRVDTTPPTGQGTAERVPNAPHTLRLEVKHGGDVAFVTAFTPWSTKANLFPSTQNGTTFYGTVPIPQNYGNKPIQITYILTDRAHNTISIQAQTPASQLVKALSDTVDK